MLGGDFWLLEPSSFFGQQPAAFFIAPLYIYVLAVLLKIGGSLAAARAAQLLLGTVAVWLVALTATRWYDRRAGWIAGGLMAAGGLFTFYETLVLQAAIDPFLAALDGYLLTRAVQTGRPRDWIAAGVALDLHALNRPNLLLVAAGIALLLLARRRRDSVIAAATFLGAALIVIAPVAARNYAASGELVAVASHGGLNLYIGNGPEADGTFVSAMGIEPSIRGQWLDAPRIASEAAGRPLSAAQSSAFFRARALSWIAANPVDATKLFARKVWYTLSDDFLALNHSFGFFAYDTGSPLRFLIVTPALLVPLGVIGLIFVRPARRGFLIWAAYVPLCVLSVAIFFVAARYRLPLQVALAVGAGGGLSWLLDGALARRWRSLAPAIFAGAAVMAVVLLPTHRDDGRAEERVRMGLFALERDRLDEGERWIEMALRNHGFPGVVHLRAGQVHESRSRLNEAIRHYRSAAAIDPDEPVVRLASARVLNALEQPEAALTELVEIRELSHNAAVARELERAGLAFLLRGRHAEALDALTRAAARNPSSPSIRLNRAVALGMLGRTAEARASAEMALELDPTYNRARDFLRALK